MPPRRTTLPAAARPFRALVLLATAAAGLPGSPAPSAAQERETRVPLAPEQGVVEVDPRLRSELGLFPGVEGFRRARLFETADGGYVLEIETGGGGELARERRRLGPADVAALRERIASALQARGRTAVVSAEGRGGVVIAETALGLGFHGWAIPEALDIDSDRGRVAGYLLTAGASFLAPYLLTRDLDVSEAHRDATVYGGSRGIVWGALLGDALAGDDSDGDLALGLGVAGSVAGSVLGYRAVSASGADRGDVALWSTAGDLSLGYAFGLALAAGLFEGKETCELDVCSASEFEWRPAGEAATLAGGLAGLWGARRWSETEDYTLGDARALLSFGLLGAQAVLPLAWAVFEDADDGDRALAASLVAGSAGALWLGNRALRGRSLDDSEGLLVQAGHVAGGAVAAGLTYLVDDGEADETVYLLTTALGSGAGALFTFSAVGDGRPDGEDGRGSGDGPTLSLAPLAPVLAGLAPGDRGARPPALLRLRFRGALPGTGRGFPR